MDEASTIVMGGTQVKVLAWYARAGWLRGAGAAAGAPRARPPDTRAAPSPAPRPARYDNEWGYSCRLAELTRMVARMGA